MYVLSMTISFAKQNKDLSYQRINLYAEVVCMKCREFLLELITRDAVMGGRL